MGNQFDIGVVTVDTHFAESTIDIAVEEIQRIEKVFSTFQENSETQQVNKNAGIQPTKVSEEFFNLVQRCQIISKLTQGAFDITYGGLDTSLWNFDKSMTRLPSSEEADKSIHLIDYNKVILDQKTQTVFLKEKGMRIGFGGIGKGYAADRAKKLMIENGVQNGIVNASGDIVVWGLAPNNKKWTIGIADPQYKNSIFSQVSLTDSAIATSGNYEKYTIIQGEKYSHTIDPKTGYPIKGIKSITTICPMGEMADAMTTPIMVLGVEKGLFLVNQIKGLECIIIDDNDTMYYSQNIKISK